MHNLHGRANRTWAALLVAAILLPLLASCYGRFTLTRATYKWNGEVSDDKYIKSIVFWPMVPIHAGAAIIDALIVNVMEFWTGNRVVNAASVQPDGTQMIITPASQPGEAELRVEQPGQPAQSFLLVRLDDQRLEVRDRSTGEILLTGTRTIDGKLLLRDTSGNPVRTVDMPSAL